MRVVINGYHARSGGGISVLNGICAELAESDIDFVVLPPAPSAQSCDFIKWKWAYASPFYYYLFFLPKFLGKNDLLLNLGDLIPFVRCKQIYYLDWAYAVYDEKDIWKGMSFLDYIKRRLKKYLILMRIKYVEDVIVQTASMNSRLARMGVKSIIIFPSFVKIQSENDLPNSCLPWKEYLFVPGSSAPHKNLESLIPIINHKNLASHRWVFTCDQKFWKTRISPFLDNDNAVNLGTVSRGMMVNLYSQASLVIQPSILESFGLIYYESLCYGKRLVVSDRDFAREACGDKASYVNFGNIEEVINGIRNQQKENLKELNVSDCEGDADEKKYKLSDLIIKNLSSGL